MTNTKTLLERINMLAVMKEPRYILALCLGAIFCGWSELVSGIAGAKVGQVFSVFAGALYLIGYLVYDDAMSRGRNHPNLVSWSIWFMTVWIGASTYFTVSQDPWKMTSQAINLFLVGYFLSVAFRRPRVEGLSSYEKVSLTLTLVAIGLWWWYHDARNANFIVLAASVPGFIPVWAKVWREPESEEPGAWLLWGASQLFMVMTVQLRDQGDYFEYVAPVLSCIVHLSVGLIVLARARSDQTIS